MLVGESLGDIVRVIHLQIFTFISRMRLDLNSLVLMYWAVWAPEGLNSTVLGLCSHKAGHKANSTHKHGEVQVCACVWVCVPAFLCVCLSVPGTAQWLTEYNPAPLAKEEQSFKETWATLKEGNRYWATKGGAVECVFFNLAQSSERWSHGTHILWKDVILLPEALLGN